MRGETIACEASFNYSILTTNPEELKNFTNCDNCRELLYKDKVYRNGEIGSIYLSIEKVPKKSTTYVNFVLVKDSEISAGKITGRVGDYGIPRGPLRIQRFASPAFIHERS